MRYVHSSEVGKGVQLCPHLGLLRVGVPSDSCGVHHCFWRSAHILGFYNQLKWENLTKNVTFTPSFLLILIPTVITPIDCPGPQGFPVCVCKQHLRPYFVPWVILDHAFSSGQYLLHFCPILPWITLPPPFRYYIERGEGAKDWDRRSRGSL